MAVLRKKRPPIGARPGTLSIHEASPKPRICLTRYNETSIEEIEVADVAALDTLLSPDTIAWIDVQGLGDEQVLRALAKRFSIHPLALEDVVHGTSRPKAEAYDEHILLITRMIGKPGEPGIHPEQVGMFVGQGYVLTFQEQYGDVFDPVRERARAGAGPLRRSGADYLGYALLDAVIDAYYPVVEALADELEVLEDLVMTRPGPGTIRRLNRAKSSLLTVRRAIAPQRDAVNRLIRDDSPFISDTVKVYLRDVYDHCIQTNEAVEASREMASGLMNTYLSVVSNRTNDVMKVLTIVASIFVPLTFMAGIYGMNFENMPELKLPWGYPALIVAMLIVGLGMLLFFQRRGWLSSGDAPDDPGDS